MVTENPEIQDEIEEVLTEEVTEENTEEEKAPERKKNRVTAGRRIGQMRREIGDRDRTIDAKNREIEDLRANQPNQDLKAPDPDNYSTHAEYTQAQDKYIKDSIDKGTRENSKAEKELTATELKDEQTAKANEKSARDWAKKKSKAVKKYDDYADIEIDFLEDVKDLGITDILDHIGDCANGTDIVYYLKKTNPDELDRIASLGQRARTRAIGKLEDQLTSTKTQEKQLPNPTRTIQGSGGFSEKSRSKETYSERCKRINGM